MCLGHVGARSERTVVRTAVDVGVPEREKEREREEERKRGERGSARGEKGELSTAEIKEKIEKNNNVHDISPILQRRGTKQRQH